MSDKNPPDPKDTTAPPARLEDPMSAVERSFAGSFDQYVGALLSLQCQSIQAKGGAVLQPNSDDTFGVIASYPKSDDELGDAAWLQHAMDAGRQVLSQGRPRVVPVQGSERTHAVLLALQLQSSERVLEAFLVKTANRAALESTQRLLQLTVVLVGLTDQHLAQHGKTENLTRLRQAMETLAAVNRQNRFKGMAMAFCNELAAQWRCERASIGFLKGRYIRLKAMSHSENFSRKMRLVQDIEAAMEEAFDQDCEIVYPASSEASYISRAAGELSNRHGQKVLLSLPLRHEGKPQAVSTLERPANKPFTTGEVETIRLTCDLCTPRLMDLRHYDRWIGARMAARLRKVCAAVVGPEHTWLELAAVLIFAAILFLTFARGWYRVKAPFLLEASSQYKIAAPFDGFIEDVGVEVGDQIVEGQTALAKLDTAELRLQLAAAKAERAAYLTQADAAMRDGQIADAQIAQANADKVQAQIDLYAYRIEQARVLSPVSGTLVTGELKRQIGAPVQTGQVLFEVAPLDALRAELHVPEDEVSDLKVDQEGHLATATFPGVRIGFVVERINPAAEVVNNRNVFKVRVRLMETRPWMRPGMEGVAKVTVGKRRYIWIWTREVVNWIRMKLWI